MITFRKASIVSTAPALLIGLLVDLVLNLFGFNDNASMGWALVSMIVTYGASVALIMSNSKVVEFLDKK